MHLKAAAKLGVHDAEWVWLENGRGRCKRVAECIEGIGEHVLVARASVAASTTSQARGRCARCGLVF